MATPDSPPKKKRLPFKPTALRRPAASASSASPADLQDPRDDGADDLALFQRRSEMAPRLNADLERRLKKKQEKQMKEESERRRSSVAGEKRPAEEEGDEVVDGGDALISPIDDGDNVDATGSILRASGRLSSNPITPPPSKRSRNTIPSENDLPSPTLNLLREESSRRAPQTSYSQTQADPVPPQPQCSAPIILSDSDTSPPPSHAVKPSSRGREPSVEIVDKSDDEFSEYVLKAAAARARLENHQQQQQQRPPPQPSQQSSTTTTRVHPPSPSSEQVHSAEILVTSSLPNSIPCKARVRFDQPLRLLRDSWAAKQRQAGLDVPEASAILTWRRARVYNTSTLLHLGLRPQTDGRITVHSSGTSGGRVLSRSFSSSSSSAGVADRGLNDDRTSVHFEAWTHESFTEMESNVRSPSPRTSSSTHPDARDRRQQQSASPEPEVKLRVLLRSRGLANVGLTVRPATTVETLITGFRRQVSATNPEALTSNPAITLWFDGDQLEEHVTLEEMDIADRDIIDVHLK